MYPAQTHSPTLHRANEAVHPIVEDENGLIGDSFTFTRGSAQPVARWAGATPYFLSGFGLVVRRSVESAAIRVP